MKSIFVRLAIGSFTLGLALPSFVLGYDDLSIGSPVPFQVIQRVGLAPKAGYGQVFVKGKVPTSADPTSWSYRVSDWDQPQAEGEWKNWSPVEAETGFEGRITIAAGGWYRLEVRRESKGASDATGVVGPIGVGEVFIVAGQSYATNCNDERFQVTDSRSRVAAFAASKATWAVAHDPQPVPDGSDGGSIWPLLGDALAKELDVPIGFANVAYGGTSTTRWAPGGGLHDGLVQTSRRLGKFRAVLWQQGESDVIEKTTTLQYVANLVSIRDAALTEEAPEAPWLLAKSTCHPTVYDDPEGEKRIRDAIDLLLARPGFLAGPDTDTLRGENRGGPDSRRHFSAIGQRNAAQLWHKAIRESLFAASDRDLPTIGLATADITPPVGFPMAGYYHERLAEGTRDPLLAKAMVIRDRENAAALVVCDLIGISTDLSREVRRRASKATGIPIPNMVIAGTHSHTAPDYGKELWLSLGGAEQAPARKEYVDSLVTRLADVIEKAYREAQPAWLEYGVTTSQAPVAFNRRFVMRDGSTRTWQNFENRDVVRQAGPIDPEIGLLLIRNLEGKPRGTLSNYALHLDTVGGVQWSADYPYFLERALRKGAGEELISIFGTGCCGDINHVDPRRKERNSAEFIGATLGNSALAKLDDLAPIERGQLRVASEIVGLPLQDATPEEINQAKRVVLSAKRMETVDFFEHVTAYKKLMLDQLRRREPLAETSELITWGLSRSLAGIGDTLPAEVTVIGLGDELAIVCLPGEVFVELGLAIKQGSPYRQTMVIELSNMVETIYIPNRGAYAGGSYEVTNSATQPGSGEMLVEAALRLLRQTATRNP